MARTVPANNQLHKVRFDDQLGGWIVFGLREARTVLRSADRFGSSVYGLIGSDVSGATKLLGVDGSKHRRLRRAFHSVFSDREEEFKRLVFQPAAQLWCKQDMEAHNLVRSAILPYYRQIV